MSAPIDSVTSRSHTAVFTRTTFESSRLLEFFTEKELAMQIGEEPSRWPLALLKELIDNGLDAAESAGVAPEITVTIEPNLLIVQDNGPGIPSSTIERSLDYAVRVSDKANYVSPSRGQLGNALKAIWAAAFVVDGTHGLIEVEADGHRHRIDVRLDSIAQEPRISRTVERSDVKNGTKITLHWPGI